MKINVWTGERNVKSKDRLLVELSARLMIEQSLQAGRNREVVVDLLAFWDADAAI